MLLKSIYPKLPGTDKARKLNKPAQVKGGDKF